MKANEQDRFWTPQVKAWMILASVIAIAFLVFRLFIASDDKSPLASNYSSEIAAAFVGTLLTIVVTALLLDQTTRSQQKLAKDQSRSDEEREKNVAIYTKKLDIYNELMVTIETVMCADKPEANTPMKMQFQAYRTGFIADHNVVDSLKKFALAYKEAVRQDGIDDEEWGKLRKALEHLLGAMKADLDRTKGGQAAVVHSGQTSEPTNASGTATNNGTPSAPVQNTFEGLDFTSRMDRSEFLDQCDDAEKEFFSRVFDYCESKSQQVILEWGGKGVSVKDVNRRQIMWMFPQPSLNTKSNIQVRTQKFTSEETASVTQILRSNGISKGLSWRPGNSTMGFEPTRQIIDVICGINNSDNSTIINHATT